MNFMSVAIWPEGITYDSYGRPKSTDTHHTIEQAQAVCEMLKRDGFGGYGFAFPLQVLVLVKKSYTSLAVSIDTRLTDPTEDVIGYLADMAVAYILTTDNPFGGLPVQSFGDERTHKGSAFKNKRSCRRRK